MRFLDSIVIMAPAFFLHAVTATPLTTSKECVPNPKIISSLTDSFTLAIVAEDRDGRNNLKNSNPVILSTVGLFSGVEASRPAVDTANLSKSNPVGFLLKKGKLIFEGGSEAALLGPRAKPNVRGLRQFLFDPKPDPSFVPLEPINFTATGACDSLGRSYLRLGTEDGEFFLR